MRSRRDRLIRGARSICLAASLTGAGLASGVAFGQTPRSASPFVVDATLDRQSGRIGDRLVLSLILDGSAAVVMARPRIEQKLGPFQVVALDTAVPRASSGHWSQTWRLTLTTFESGRLTVPRVAVDGVLADGRAFTSTATRPLVVDIVAPRAGPDDELRPLTRRLDVQEPWPWMRIFAMAVALGLVVSGVATVGLRFWARAAARRRRRAFWLALKTDLARIGASSCTGPDDARRRYTRASSILRKGLAQVVRRRVESLPSTDLAGCVATGGADGAAMSTGLRAALGTIDAIRFGNVTPTPTVHADTLRDASRVLQSIVGLARDRHRGLW